MSKMILIEEAKLKQALEALEYFSDTSPTMAGKAHAEDAITALRTAIEQAEKQEPYGYLYEGIEYHTKGKTLFYKKPVKNLESRWWSSPIAVYTTPPAAPVQKGN